MKIISPDEIISSESSPAWRGVLLNIADSALTKGNRPFFLPDLNAPYSIFATLLFPVIKQGKSISERFAKRYVGTPCPAVMFRAHGTDIPGSSLYSFDGAVHHGETITDFDTLWEVGAEKFHLTSEYNYKQFLYNIISSYSGLNTLKMGDWFSVPLFEFKSYVKPDIQVKITSGSSTLLKFNIK
ncbi:MAG: hypothetical protein NC201_03625 [Prevotella sp.]|nr:hypothetical protein [Bacteroides sp.]MCM1366318.1 hypothetical protein [Prevotella sp.]MCM1437122.1 hypothetical protein [Prevotella sp.]